MKEEDYIQRHVGTENPFNVPDGYFDNLTDQIMARLPERNSSPQVQTARTVTLWDRVKPWLYMAAMFIGAALIIRVATQTPATTDDAAAILASDESESDMVYINSVMDNTMLDSYSLYVLLSDAEGY